MKQFFSLFFCICVLCFLAHSLVTKTSVFSDAKFYFSYTHSLVFNKKLLLGNEFKHFGIIPKTPPDGFVPSYFPPGVSIFWLPLFYFTYAIYNLIKIFVPSLVISGYEIPFEYACALTNIVLGVSGLYLVYKILLKYFTKQVSLLTTSALFLTTNLFFYTAVEPINSHAASFFMSALFLFYLLNYQRDKHYYLILGLIAGFSAVVRTQDVLLITIPVVKAIFDNYKHFKRFIVYLLKLTSGAILGLLPQILLWKYFYNTFWYSPYFNTGFNFLRPQIGHVLFNLQNGLFSLTPIVGIAFLGMIFKLFQLLNKYKFNIKKLFKNKNTENQIYILTTFYFLAQLYLISSWNDYTQGGSYSIRMMITTYPLLVFGLAFVISSVIRKIGGLKTTLLIGGFGVINFLMIINYLLRF